MSFSCIPGSVRVGHVVRRERASSGRHAGTAGPHRGIATFGALFAGRPRMYGKYYPRPTRAQIACSYWGSAPPPPAKPAGASPLTLASLATSGSLHADRPFAPELNQWSPIRGIEDACALLDRRPAPYQAGGPPLGFERTGLSLLGLHGYVGGTLGCGQPGQYQAP